MRRTLPACSKGCKAFIAIGSNLGDRAGNMRKAMAELKNVVSVERVSGLYETRAQYVSEQPDFLNAVCRVSTSLEPRPLLAALKDIEQRLGRTAKGIRYGPRVIDLDILFYGDRQLDLPADAGLGVGELTIPHPRFAERDFVLYPLADLDPPPTLPSGDSFEELLAQLEVKRPEGQPLPLRVLAGPSNRSLVVDRRSRSNVMGILNVTPDSFSDGGKVRGVQDAVDRALHMATQGATIIDVGGESTRPGAKAVEVQEEIDRVAPVIEGIRAAAPKDLWVSIDTRRAAVAKAAVTTGADMVNDVSGGTFDPDMLPTVTRLGVPYVMMHMRGDPATMTSLAKYGKDVAQEVGEELGHQVRKAQEAGICSWDIVVDPGIGFAKNMEHNLALLARLGHFIDHVNSSGNGRFPVLVGASRKRFLGTVCDRPSPEDRDVATSAAHTLAIDKGAGIVRVHQVPMAVDAAAVADAIRLTDC